LEKKIKCQPNEKDHQNTEGNNNFLANDGAKGKTHKRDLLHLFSFLLLVLRSVSPSRRLRSLCVVLAGSAVHSFAIACIG